MFNIFGRVGASVLRSISIFSGLLSLLYYSIVGLFSGELKGKYYIRREITMQVYFTGVNAVTLISIIALAIGVITIFQLNSYGSYLSGFGQENMMGKILVTVIIRELGPLLTSIIIIARSGTAIAAHIGTMTVSHEIEAIETLGIDNLSYLVFPRIVGMVVSLIILNIYFDVVSIVGGVIVAKILDPVLSIRAFFENFFESFNYYDIIETFVKSIFFGCGISVICVINGFKAGNSSTNIPIAATKGVVSSLIYVFFINAVITILFLI
ncbi:MlaE family ABC transporter permease [Spirochaetota bacterium]